MDDDYIDDNYIDDDYIDDNYIDDNYIFAGSSLAGVGRFGGAGIFQLRAQHLTPNNIDMMSPSQVRAWRASGAIEGPDWHRLRAVLSTGEAASASDSHWLMAALGYTAPVVEYIGGTELAGALYECCVLFRCWRSCVLVQAPFS